MTASSTTRRKSARLPRSEKSISIKLPCCGNWGESSVCCSFLFFFDFFEEAFAGVGMIGMVSESSETSGIGCRCARSYKEL